jgi:type IV secretion system protein VirB2
MNMNKLRAGALAAGSSIAAGQALAGGVGGLAKGATLLNTVSTWMTTIGITIVTIALMVVGFRMVFQAAEWKDVAPVFWGGVIIGSASGIAAMFIG